MSLPQAAKEALDRLREGNRRFVANERNAHAVPGRERLNELVEGQQPFAVILGCADSRSPAEILFDQELGDLFVIRVAGNVAAPTQIGSVEFAVEQLGPALVVVLGHTGCGAVEATIQVLSGGAPVSDHLSRIVDLVRPSVEPLLGTAGDLHGEAVRAHVRASVTRLQDESEIIRRAVDEGRLAVVGAVFNLDPGTVDFLV